MRYVRDIKFVMLQVREKGMSLRKWSGGTAHLRWNTDRGVDKRWIFGGGEISRDTGNGVHDGGRGDFYKSIIGNFMVYHDRIETKLLELFAHPETSEWFSRISGIIFEVDIVSE